MSWHTSAILLNTELGPDVPEFLSAIGFINPEPGEIISGEDASSHLLEAVAAVSQSGWTLIFNSPEMFGTPITDESGTSPLDQLWPDSVDQVLADTSRTCRVFSFLMEGFTHSYGFADYDGGQRRRQFVHAQGRVQVDEGAPLPGETESSPLKTLEFKIFEVAERCCPEFNELLDASYKVCTYSAAPE